uniref:Reverse transcriptase domain-containing protein n=1 Tax=Ananas comosus var. bracteatus TaxID=296719 RepID=A0A6V7Q8N8_ANACO|nr:unnamed protein product [Ananas comosus var. bracteatus]
MLLQNWTIPYVTVLWVRSQGTQSDLGVRVGDVRSSDAEHEKHLRFVLQILRERRLFVKLKKCECVTHWTFANCEVRVVGCVRSNSRLSGGSLTVFRPMARIPRSEVYERVGALGSAIRRACAKILTKQAEIVQIDVARGEQV